MKLYKISTKNIIILALCFVFLINYVSYEYFLKKFFEKEKKLLKKINEFQEKIKIEKEIFNKNLSIFRKIKELKYMIAKKEKDIEILKNKIKTEKDISHILKLLTSETGVILNNVELYDVKKGKNQVSLFFKFSGTGRLINLIKLIDAIEEKNDLLIIDNYNLKKGKISWTITMIIKTVYLVVE